VKGTTVPTETVFKIRTYEVKVDSQEALKLHRAGKSLRQIAEALAPGASRMAVSRAIQRAKKSEAGHEPTPNRNV
jgi:hypothetical protein